MPTTILRFLNVILAALLGGSSFGMWMGFNISNFFPSTYVALQQNTIHMLNALMISLVIMATIITTGVAAFDWRA